DSCGLLPLRAAERVFPTAYAFRRFLQKNLPSHLNHPPVKSPLHGVSLPPLRGFVKELRTKWPLNLPQRNASFRRLLSSLPIDHSIGQVPVSGGASAALQTLRVFLRTKIARYVELRNDPEADVTSGLSPYLHFGFLSSHQVLFELAKQEHWASERIGRGTLGHKSGWWGMSATAEAFLDQIVTWREIGFNFCHLRDDCDQFESLPVWARATLKRHAADPRPRVYEKEELTSARTHDELWNAAQTQLAREGRIQNYLRMLWGKKILEWSPSPELAMTTMIELNDRYALDGGDPNSYSGIGWVLGRYDRPWGPERPVFGTVRYMSSENTARKFRVQEYLRRYAGTS
ncbi:MAG: deoxyribodipyrimidine photolyase, partial [bacterium]|nr:deoxyribodipyrimidine photolyase [bacterium]